MIQEINNEKLNNQLKQVLVKYQLEIKGYVDAEEYEIAAEANTNLNEWIANQAFILSLMTGNNKEDMFNGINILNEECKKFINK